MRGLPKHFLCLDWNSALIQLFLILAFQTFPPPILYFLQKFPKEELQKIVAKTRKPATRERMRRDHNQKSSRVIMNKDAWKKKKKKIQYHKKKKKKSLYWAEEAK